MSATAAAGDSALTLYNFAVLRVVPHVHIGSPVAIGVIVHAPTEQLVAMRAISDPASLRALVPGIDHDMLSRYIAAYRSVCDGDPAAGWIALGSPSERFHWLTAPRSDVLQAGPVHEGVCSAPAAVVDDLFAAYINVPGTE